VGITLTAAPIPFQTFSV